MAAPAVNPIATVCDIKFTNAPMRISPIVSSKIPTMNVSVRTRPTYSPVPGCAKALIEVKINRDAAVVGPDTRCHDEPKNAAMIAGSMPA